MPALKDIRRRLKAIKNTQKITRAMKMVSAAKLRKAQTRMLELRPYAEKMSSVIASMAGGMGGEIHPLIAVRPRKTVELVVISADRGLCGAFNSNILKSVANFISGLKKEGLEVSISVIGKKTIDYYKRRNLPLRRSWTGLSGRVIYSNAQEIANDIMENYLDKTFDEVFLIYNEFKSVISQKVSINRLLPLAPIESAEESFWGARFIYEPSQSDIFNKLLPKNVEIQVYRALLESQASEEAARMTAMENATKNCDDLIERVTLQYNKARQAAITKELMDIVGGVEALK